MRGDPREPTLRCVKALVILENPDGPAPGFLLEVVDLAKLEQVTMQDVSVGKAFVFDQAGTAMPFATFLRDVARNITVPDCAPPARSGKRAGLHHRHF